MIMRIFYAKCPCCGFDNIFNRMTDLQTVQPITFKQVTCQNGKCLKNFNINGDLSNAAYEMLIYDCYELFRNKKYSYCILNLAQACEVFFNLYLTVKLVYIPFDSESDNDEQLNSNLQELYRQTKMYAFIKMQNIFINLLDVPVNNMDDGRDIILRISDYHNSPTEEKLQGIQNEELRDLVLQLINLNISSLRNKVIHKIAYRPNAQETEAAIEDTRRIIFSLARQCDMHGDEPNSYLLM